MEKKDKNFIRRYSKVLKCIELKGGICKHCKRNLIDKPWEADFHHEGKEAKENSISQLIDYHISEAVKELEKCILLCCSCHRLVHFNVERYNKYKDIIKSNATDMDMYKGKKVDKEKVYLLRKEGNTPTKIAMILHSTRRTIEKNLRELEIIKNERLLNTRQEYANILRKITDKEILDCRQNGMSYKEICSQYKLTLGGLSKRVKKLKERGLIKE